MAISRLRAPSVLFLALFLAHGCDSQADRKSWPVPRGASARPSPRPPELADDVEAPLRVGLKNFGLVFVREPSRATIERWVDQTGWLVPVPYTTVTVTYPDHTFVVSDAECRNGELDIDGVRWQGGAFGLSADGSIQVVTASNSLELLRESAQSAVPEPPGD